MDFYNLNDLNIKIIDFTMLLSPLGVVKKIVSNDKCYLFEIYFHEKININNGTFKINNNNNIDNTLLSLFYDNNYGFIINESSCIIQVNNLIEKNSKFTLGEMGKYLRKNIPIISQKILKFGLDLSDKNKTNPDTINIINFNGFKKVCL